MFVRQSERFDVLLDNSFSYSKTAQTSKLIFHANMFWTCYFLRQPCRMKRQSITGKLKCFKSGMVTYGSQHTSADFNIKNKNLIAQHNSLINFITAIVLQFELFKLRKINVDLNLLNPFLFVSVVIILNWIFIIALQ